MDANKIKEWAKAAKSAYRHCIKNGITRAQARSRILNGLKRQGAGKERKIK